MSEGGRVIAGTGVHTLDLVYSSFLSLIGAQDVIDYILDVLIVAPVPIQNVHGNIRNFDSITKSITDQVGVLFSKILVSRCM